MKYIYLYILFLANNFEEEGSLSLKECRCILPREAKDLTNVIKDYYNLFSKSTKTRCYVWECRASFNKYLNF